MLDATLPSVGDIEALKPRTSMSDSSSFIRSLLVLVTNSIRSMRSLQEAIKRYQTSDATSPKTLRRLLDVIEDTEDTLKALKQLIYDDTVHSALHDDISMVALLRSPVERCCKICSQFEEAIAELGRASEIGSIDRTKMEFMRADINQFMYTVAGYKATISVGLGVLTM